MSATATASASRKSAKKSVGANSRPNKATGSNRGRQATSFAGDIPPHHDEFCRARAMGVVGWMAYRDHVANEWMDSKNASNAASRLLALPKIRERVKFWRAKLGPVLDQLGFDKEDAMRFLAEGITKPLIDIDESDPHAQEVTKVREIVQGKDGEEAHEIETVKIKSVSKIDALKQLALMGGWNADTKATVKVTASPEMRNALRVFYGKPEEE